MSQVEQIAALNDEIEAQRLDAELVERGIPHIMRSNHDTAYDGLFQSIQGWGHVEAASGFGDEILGILHSIRQEAEDSQNSSV